MRDGGGAGRQPPARVRTRQVRQPQRDGRLRGRVAGRRAVDGAGQPPVVARSRAHRDRPDPLRGRRAAPRGAIRARAERLPADRVRLDLRVDRPAGARGTHPPPRPVPHLRRSPPLPPVRCRLRLGRGRRRAHRAGVRRVGLDPRPLVGRPLRRRPTAARRRAAARPGGDARRLVPDDLVPGGDAAAGRQPVRAAPALPDRHRSGLPAEDS